MRSSFRMWCLWLCCALDGAEHALVVKAFEVSGSASWMASAWGILRLFQGCSVSNYQWLFLGWKESTSIQFLTWSGPSFASSRFISSYFLMVHTWSSSPAWHSCPSYLLCSSFDPAVPSGRAEAVLSASEQVFTCKCRAVLPISCFLHTPAWDRDSSSFVSACSWCSFP